MSDAVDAGAGRPLGVDDGRRAATGGRGVRLAHADSHATAGRPGRAHGPPGARARAARRRRPPARSAPAAGPGPRSPTSGARASSATATASSTPRRSAGWPARRRCSCSPTTTSAPASPTPSRSPRSPRPWPGRSGLNVALTEAIALGHDCGHGPGGHASEDALSPYVPGGYDHAVWGADVTLAPLNLCAETLDGIRNHSWSRPAPATPEGEVVSWADRIAYVCHDFEDAVAAGIVAGDMLPAVVADRCGSSPLAPARRVHPGDGRRRRRDGPDRHDRAGRRGARRVPPVQLRARLPAPGQHGPGRRRHRPAAGARRALRRPAPPAARSAAGRRAGPTRPSPPPSPTSPG